MVATIAMLAIGLSVAHADDSSGQVSLDGRLMVAHGMTRHGATTMQTALQTSHGMVPLTVPSSRHSQLMSLAGKKVRVRGKSTGATFSTTTLAATGDVQAAAATRTIRIALILMHDGTKTTENPSVASATSMMFGTGNSSIADYYSQVSGGQASVTGQVFGYYDTPKGTDNCDLSGMTSAAATAAAAGGYHAANFDYLVVATPHYCSQFAGIAWVGASGVLVADAFTQHVVEHELGHNLGFWHAGAYSCLTASNCNEYGDYTDVMGNGVGYGGYHLEKLGWLPESEVASINKGSNTYSLDPIDTPNISGSTELVKITVGSNIYTVERRALAGANGWVQAQLDVKLITRVKTDDVLFVAQLTPNTAWTDPTGAVTVTQLDNNDATKDDIVKKKRVQVCFGTCTTGPTSTSTSTSSTSSTSTTSPSSTSTTTTTVPGGGNNQASVYFDHGRIIVTGTPGNDNIHLQQLNGRRYIDAGGAPLTIGVGCKADPTSVLPTAICREGQYHVSLGDGNDRVSSTGRVRSWLDGGAGNDTFIGGTGSDTFIGGDGVDTVDYTNRAPGSITVLVGGGPHSGAKHEGDTIGSDIENVLTP